MKGSQNRKLSRAIAGALGETQMQPLRQIELVVELCGSRQVRNWLAQAQEIEAAGGMLIRDGSRRRTLGGVFFAVVQEALKKAGEVEKLQQIFWRRPFRERRKGHDQDKDKDKEQSPNKGQAPPPQPLPIFTWEERGMVITEAVTDPGEVRNVKVTLIGRPIKTVEKQQFTLLMIKQDRPLPPLPKGIPIPTTLIETIYVVYIGAKQWRSVAKALQNPDDQLIVEGTQIYDEEYEAVTVFAMSTTTRLLQQERRKPPSHEG